MLPHAVQLNSFEHASAVACEMQRPRNKGRVNSRQRKKKRKKRKGNSRKYTVIYSWLVLTNFDIEVYQSELHHCQRHTRASIRTNRRVSLSLRWLHTLTPSSPYVAPFETSNGALRIVWTRYGLDDKVEIFEKRLFERYTISFDSIGASEFVSVKFVMPVLD